MQFKEDLAEAERNMKEIQSDNYRLKRQVEQAKLD